MENISGIDSAKAVDLGSTVDPEGTIDLTKPLTETQFRTASVALANNTNEGIAQMLFHLSHGLPALVQLIKQQNEMIKHVIDQIGELSIVEFDQEQQAEDESE